MKKGTLPVHKDLVDQDWDKLIAEAQARRKNLATTKSKLPTIYEIAKKCGGEVDYFGPYSYFSDATHSGAGELDIYVEFNVDNTAAISFRYGPNDGPWIPWCTLIATGYLRDCIKITSVIFGITKDRLFVAWFKARCKRHEEMLDRYRDQLSADFKAGKS